MKLVKEIFSIKPKANGRIRYRLFGKRDGFIAVRTTKRRFGIQSGKVFKQVHLGKVSVAIEKQPANTWNFSG